MLRKRSFATYENGLLLAVRKSKFEVIEERFLVFRQRAGLERLLSRRGAWLFRLQPKQAGVPPFVVVSTHLQVVDVDSCGRPTNAAQVEAHRAQVKQLMDWIRAHNAAGDPVVFLGDTNVGEGYAEAEHRNILAELNAVDGFSAAIKQVGHGLTWNDENALKRENYSHEPESRVDHVLFSKGSEAHFEPTCAQILADRNYYLFMSDHWGLLVQATLHTSIP